jgi:hypothetical protein
MEKEQISENIAALYEHLDGKKNRTAIFRHYRSIDDSGCWPILGRFNATNRAINRLYRFERSGGYYLTGLELCYFLEAEISEIVNSY